MAKAAGGSPQKVNPVLLIVLGIVVIVGVYFIFFQGNSSSGDQGVAPVTKLHPVTTGNPTGAKNKDGVTADTNSPNKAGAPDDSAELARNPFLTPPMYLKDTTTPNNSNSTNKTPNLDQVTNNQQTSTSPNSNPGDKKDDLKDLRYSAIFEKNKDRVVLIYYMGKGYILRENDRIPNAGFQIKEIKDKSVVLVNEKGEEKVLLLKGGEKKS